MPVMRPTRVSDDKNKNIKRVIFWLLQGILAVFFILISYAASKIIFSDILHLTLEKFPTIYLVIPFGIFLFLVLLDVLLVYLIKYFMASSPKISANDEDGKESWIQWKNWVILVSVHIFLAILFLAISLGLSYLLFYTLSRWEHEPDFLLIILVAPLLFVFQAAWYINSRKVPIISTQKGIKTIYGSPRKDVSEGLNVVWWLEELILVPLGRFEIELKVEDIWTEPGREPYSKYQDENGNEITEYEELDMQKIDVEVGIYTEFKKNKQDLFGLVRTGAPEILAVMRSNISIDEILSLERFKRGTISKEEEKEIRESYRVRPLVPEQIKRLIQIAIERNYDSLIKGIVKQNASKKTYRGLNRDKDVVANGIGDDLKVDETFKKSGLSDNIQIRILQIVLPKEVEEAAKGREVAKKNKQATITIAEGKKEADILNADAEAYKANKQADSRKYEKKSMIEAKLQGTRVMDSGGNIVPGKEQLAVDLVVMEDMAGAIKESEFKVYDVKGIAGTIREAIKETGDMFKK